MDFANLISKRRSIYSLGSQLPIEQKEVISLVENGLKQCPSAFNSQPGRIVLLFGNSHHKLWQITSDSLKKIVAAEQFSKTQEKISFFANGAGTVLFFIDESVTSELQKTYPSYAANFPIWAEQAEGMLQYIIWSLFAEKEIGASLQHYNPLIDEDVHKAFNIPNFWRLSAEMPFGNIICPAEEKSFLSMEKRLKIFV